MVLGLALVPACASAPKTVPVVGRSVSIQTDGEGPKVKGELLAVGSDRLWVRTKEGVRDVPLPTVRRIDVKRHGFGARKALTWAVVGAVVTGGALAGACASVEGDANCGIGLVAAGIWLVTGALVAPSAERSSYFQVARPVPEELRPYARLPQGLPEGLNPASLGVPPNPRAPAPEPRPSPSPSSVQPKSPQP